MNLQKKPANPHNKKDLEPENQSLNIACRYSPIVANSLKRFGHQPIKDFLEHFSISAEPGFQEREDLFKTVSEYVSPLLGESIARQTVQDLSQTPVVLTANHHGVDYFAQSVQGSLLFSLYLLARNPASTTVPVFACANIPLNNLTYPRGLMIYNLDSEDLGAMPRKVPVFSDKMKRAMVCTARPFDKAMIDRTGKRISKMTLEGQISSRLSTTLNTIIEEDYADPFILALDSYSQQSVVLNHRIWKRLYADKGTAPDLVYLDLEHIVGQLLEIDLQNPNSLAWSMLFDPELRTRVLGMLDGKKACWQQAKLALRFQWGKMDDQQRKAVRGCGTHFFWGMDSSNKLVPLYVGNPDGANGVLEGKDDRGNTWRVPLTPESICQNILEKKLVPSLFTCYSTISLARGVTCIGGYYQSEYLPVMQQGVVNALKHTPGYEKVVPAVEKVNTSHYLSGMQTIMSLTNGGSLIPAGPVEIIAGGGIEPNDIDRLMGLTVKDAHIASLFETIPDVAPHEAMTAGWKDVLARECYHSLKDKIVIKN